MIAVVLVISPPISRFPSLSLLSGNGVVDRTEIAKAYARQHGCPAPDVLLDAMMALLVDKQGSSCGRQKDGDENSNGVAFENATIARAEYESFAK